LESPEDELNLASQAGISSSIAFAQGIRLVKTLEDGQGNSLNRPANPGEVIYYVFHIGNNSSQSANDIVITDVIPESVTLVDKTIYHYDDASRTLSISIGSIGVNN